MRAAIYGRKSSEDERSSEDGRSVDRQVTLAREFIVRQGWTVDEEWVITDDDYSGADFTRPGLVRLLAGAKAKPRAFDAIVMLHIDRLGREQVRTATAMQDLHAAGVEVWTYQDGQRVKFETPIDKLLLGVHGFGAEEYRHQVKLKTREALVEKAKRGHFTGQRTFGYTSARVGDHSERRIDETHAAVIRRVFEMAAGGAGDLKIARTLTEEHVSAPGPKGWSKQIVRHLLTNALYIGLVIYGRSKTIDDGARGRRAAVPKDEWTTVTLPGLQIVPEAVWTAVQRRKATTRAHYLRAPDGRLMGKPESGLAALHLLNGIARCGECGGALTFMMKSGRSFYYCSTYRSRGTCRNARGIPAFTFESAVCTALYRMLVDDRESTTTLLTEQITRVKLEQAREQAAHGGERKQVEREITRLEKEIANLIGAIAGGKASSADVISEINRRRAEVGTLALKLKPVKPVLDLDEDSVAPLKFFDKAKWLERVATLGVAALAPLTNPYNPALVRQVLRALGVTRIVVKREPDGWAFSGMAHLDKVVCPVPKDARPPPNPPPGSVAPAKPALDHAAPLGAIG